MVIEVILGAVIGTGALAALGIWYTRTQNSTTNPQEEQESVDTSNDSPPLLLDLPIEKKLRNSLYESERNEEKCLQEVDRIYSLQLDLLEDIGKPSYILLKNKPAFFVLHHPITGDTRYYYQRDLNPDIDEHALTETQKLLLTYTEHIELYQSKIKLFKKLQVSHKENLIRINAMQEQNSQMAKIKKHQKKIQELESQTEMEVKAYMNEQLVKDIEEELAFQEECLEQYSELTKKYNPDMQEHVDQQIKFKIQDIIDKLEDKDPSNK